MNTARSRTRRDTHRKTIDLNIREPSVDSYSNSPIKKVEVTRCELQANDNITLELQIQTEPFNIKELIMGRSKEKNGKNLLQQPIRFVESSSSRSRSRMGSKRNTVYKSINWERSMESQIRREDRLKKMVEYGTGESRDQYRDLRYQRRDRRRRPTPRRRKENNRSEYKRPPRRFEGSSRRREERNRTPMEEIHRNNLGGDFDEKFESFGEKVPRDVKWRDGSARRRGSASLWAPLR